MLGLLGTLDLAARGLATQRQGVEVAGHNLTNASNTAYSRQRVAIQSTVGNDGRFGSYGTGSEVVAIQQIRSELLDSQLVNEGSVGGSLQAQQRGLQYAQARLGQNLDRTSSGSDVAAGAGLGGGRQISAGLAQLFTAFQSLSANPTSISERQVTLSRASDLASQFNQIDANLGGIETQLNESLGSDAQQANHLLGDIAKLNERISRMEASGSSPANDLRDHRQAKLEELSKLVRFDSVQGADGAVDIAISGVSFVSSGLVSSRLETFDSGGGRLEIRASGTATALPLTGGSLHGTLDVREGPVRELRLALRSIAESLIVEVNGLHAGGFGLGGTTGQPFFVGTTATDIRVNPALIADPAKIQASGDAASPGNNQVVLTLAQLSSRGLTALGGQTFTGRHGAAVAALGESLASVNRQISDHEVVSTMLISQRDSVSGVSLDEEMTNLTRFQRAYQASAKLITTVDEMLEVTLGLKR